MSYTAGFNQKEILSDDGLFIIIQTKKPEYKKYNY